MRGDGRADLADQGLELRIFRVRGQGVIDGVEYGLVVTEVGDKLSASPIRAGDVIVAVNQTRFKSLEEFNKLVAAQKSGERVALLVRRGQGSIYVPVEVG